MSALDRISYAVVRLFTGVQPISAAPEILARMKLPDGDIDPDAVVELLDDSVRLMYDAKLSAMTRRLRRETMSMGDDELASWLYDMCVDAIPETRLRARVLLSAACVRHVGRVR